LLNSNLRLITTMSKKMILLAAAFCFSLNVYAEEPLAEAEATVEATQEHAAPAHSEEMAAEHAAPAHNEEMAAEHGAAHGGEHEGSAFYVVGKYFSSTGASYKHGTNIISGGNASGFAADFGVGFGGHMAVELSVASGSGTFTETAASVSNRMAPTLFNNASGATSGTSSSSHESTELNATYSSVAVVGVYGIPVSDQSAFIMKLGGINESEKLDVVGSSSASGAVYAFGFETKMGNHKEFVVEYEGTSVEGPRASTVLFGLKFGL